MADNSDAQKNENSKSSEKIKLPIRQETAGAVAGAAVGSVAGPIGAVVGGVVAPTAENPPKKQPPLGRKQDQPLGNPRSVLSHPRNSHVSDNPPGKLQRNHAKPRSRLSVLSQPRKNRASDGPPGKPLPNHVTPRELGENRHRRGLPGSAAGAGKNDIRESGSCC